MTTYYKGKIFLTSKNHSQHKLDVNIINNRIISYNDDEFTKLLKQHMIYRLVNHDLANYISSILWSKDKRNNYATMHSVLDDIFRKLSTDIQSEIDIIYEVVECDNNTKYGKELLTGMLFPLYENTKLFEYSVTLKDNRQRFWTTDIYDDLYVLDSEEKGYLRNIFFQRIKRPIIKEHDQYKIVYHSPSKQEIQMTIHEARLEEYELTANAIYRDQNYLDCKSLIKENGLASLEDIEEYRSKAEKKDMSFSYFDMPVNYQDYIIHLSKMNLLRDREIKIRKREP